MPFINPADYDEAETLAMRIAPNRVTEAYRPQAFMHAGYPTHIDESAELFRYVDAMNEGSKQIEDITEKWLAGLTEEEFLLAKSLCQSASDMAIEVSGRNAVPMVSALGAFISLRYIRYLFPSKDSVILELGPGTGSVGAMLSMLGYKYLSMDVTQAFYLYQSRLYDRIAGDRFVELAADPRPLSDFKRPAVGQNIHIPWWKFVPDDPDELHLDIDCILVAGAIAEMHINATKYLARQARRWLSNSPGEKAFIIVGPGDDRINPMPGVLAEIQQAGLENVYSDKGGADGQMFDRDVVHILRPTRP